MIINEVTGSGRQSSEMGEIFDMSVMPQSIKGVEVLGRRERIELANLEFHVDMLLQVINDQIKERGRATQQIWEEYQMTLFLITLAKKDLEKALNPVPTTANIEGYVAMVVPETFDIDDSQEIQEAEAFGRGS